MMEDYLGRPFRAIMSVEIGGGNALQPFLAAALLGLPVVDADAMGRAFPEAQMTSFAIDDLQIYPLTLVDVRDNEVIVARAASWKWMERLSRKACVEVGSIAATCKAPRTGKEVKECGILNTTTQGDPARTVGRRRRAGSSAIPIQALLEAEGGSPLPGEGAGREPPDDGGIPPGLRRGSTASMPSAVTLFRLEFQNEFAVGWLDGEPRVTVPDLICVLDSRLGRSDGDGDRFATASGSRSIVLPARRSCSPRRGLELVGPRAFGYDLDFRSVFAAEAHRNRRRRHQHRRRAPREAAGRPRGQDPDHRGRHERAS